ncbi:hypothetical protein EPUL_004138, partial [Erysiphe pulchra]
MSPGIAEITEELEEIVRNDNEHEWTQDEISYQMFTGVFNSNFNLKDRKLHLGFKDQNIKTERCKVPESHDPIVQSQPRSVFQPSQFQNNRNLPSRQSNDPTQTGFELSNLMKIYKDDIRYSGSDDILDLQLQIFYDFAEIARDYYYTKIANRERRLQILSRWNTMKLRIVVQENPNKSKLECFEILVDKLQKIQVALSTGYQDESNLRDAVINACRDVHDHSMACLKSAPAFEGVCSDIRASIATAMRLNTVSAFTGSIYEHFFIDRRYKGTQSKQSRKGGYGPSQMKYKNNTHHTKEERDKVYSAFEDRLKMHNKPHGQQNIRQYVVEFEGEQEEEEDLDIWNNLIMNMTISESDTKNEFNKPGTSGY